MGVNAKNITRIADLILAATQVSMAAMATAQQGQTLLQSIAAEGRDPSPDEIAALEDQVAGLRGRLNAPLPQEQNTDG